MSPPCWSRALAPALFALSPVLASALDVRFEPVADNVYAYIGDTGARSPKNEGLNANPGLIVTPAGAVLIDSGASHAGARLVHNAVAALPRGPCAG